MDALSAALGSVRMTGAIFFNAICTAPWGFAVPSMRSVAHILAPGTERIVGYHLLTEGKARVTFEDGCEAALAPGDVIIVPHGDPHTVVRGSPSRLIDSATALRDYVAGDLGTVHVGSGDGETTRFICGYFGCERHADRLFLAGLPTMLRFNVRGDSAGRWLETSIRHLVSDLDADRPGRSVMLSKMAEALFVEALRRYMEELPQEETGWLAGARDAVVGAALARIHRQTRYPWTIARLASEIGTSRSVLTERFTRLLGEPPLHYLARWRLQLAARLLETTRNTIAQVAGDVGYESEAAFNRAFKREFGTPPGRYRSEVRSAGADGAERNVHSAPSVVGPRSGGGRIAATRSVQLRSQ
jgi:AraC-like DNA-binding protein